MNDKCPKITSRINWRQGDLIRHISTGKLYSVIHVFIDNSTQVYDPASKELFISPQIILPRDYDKFCKDSEWARLRKDGEWSYQPLVI